MLIVLLVPSLLSVTHTCEAGRWPVSEPVIAAATCVVLCLSGVVNILLVALRWVILNNKTLCERETRRQNEYYRENHRKRERGVIFLIRTRWFHSALHAGERERKKER